MLDPSIILSGRTVDMVGSMARGNALAQGVMETNRAREMQDLYRTQGAGIANGDPGALNALAAFDPMAALDVQGTRLGMDATRQNMSIQSSQEARAAEAAKRDAAEYAATKSAQEVAAAQTRIADGLNVARMAKTPEEWDAMAQRFGAPELVGKFDQRNELVTYYQTFNEALAPMAAKDRYQTVDGRLVDIGAEGGPKIVVDQQPKNDPLSDAAKLKADLDAGRLTPADYEAEQARRAKSGVNIDMGGGTDKQVFDAMNESYAAANAAITGLNSLAEAKKAVDAGIVSGTGADYVLGLRKVGQLVGVGDTSVITNTETFRSAIAPQIAAMMKATVGSTQISNADREFAEKAAGGSIALDASSIKRLMGIMEKAGRVVVERHQKRLDEVYPDTPDGKYKRERAIFGVDAPASGPTVVDGYQIEEMP
jgi:hypothetical protein